MLTSLQGKKTYLVALVAGLLAAAYQLEWIDKETMTAIGAFLGASGLATLRAAIAPKACPHCGKLPTEMAPSGLADPDAPTRPPTLVPAFLLVALLLLPGCVDAEVRRLAEEVYTKVEVARRASQPHDKYLKEPDPKKRERGEAAYHGLWVELEGAAADLVRATGGELRRDPR